MKRDKCVRPALSKHGLVDFKLCTKLISKTDQKHQKSWSLSTSAAGAEHLRRHGKKDISQNGAFPTSPNASSDQVAPAQSLLNFWAQHLQSQLWCWSAKPMLIWNQFWTQDKNIVLSLSSYGSLWRSPNKAKPWPQFQESIHAASVCKWQIHLYTSSTI